MINAIRSLKWGAALFLLSFVVAAALHFFTSVPLMGNDAAAQKIMAGPWLLFAFMALIFAPIVETVISQWLPVELMLQLRAPRFLIVLICGLIFGIGHFRSNGLSHGINMFFSGMILGELYVRRRQESAASSFVAVATAHFFCNLLVILSLLILKP